MRVKPRVIVVEDEAIAARAIKHMVETVGCYVVAILNSAEEAVERIEADKPDVVLMDIRLKGAMNGMEGATVVRDRLGVPVVLVTAYSTRELFEHYGIDKGFPCITKPVEEGDLAAAIRAVTGHASRD